MDAPHTRERGADVAVAATLFAATAGYLALMPRALGASDEAAFLYEAKRMAEGAVLYRDIFNIWTPGAYWAMDLLFRIFGAELGTARVAMAVLHGLVVVAVYAGCRVLGVRRLLAAPVALAHVAVYQPAWPYASAHWLTVAVNVLLTIVLLRTRVEDDAARAFGPGVVAGLVVTVQHHKGVFSVLGAAAVVALRPLLARRRSPLLPRLFWYAGGVATVAIPVAAVLVWTAGAGNVFDALVLQPMQYRQSFRIHWGEVHFLNVSEARYTLPLLLRWPPLFLVLGVAHLGVAIRRRSPDAAALLTVVVMTAAAACSILYFPDFIHIAFVGPMFSLLIAHELEWAARAARARVLGAVVGVALLVAVAIQAVANARRAAVEFPLRHPTPFGTLAFRRSADVALVDRLRGLVDATPSRELFSYPVYPAVYLLTGARNPTRHTFVLPGYSTPAQLAEVIDALDARRVPYVVVVKPFVRPHDAVVEHLARAYEPVEGFDAFEGLAVYRRKE
ncbi:MAG TPA: hypothetical protein VKA21_06870 [Candidatus Binatia bacterium]|nr:hypothetical protein [Candidatus Binatia bacterium]